MCSPKGNMIRLSTIAHNTLKIRMRELQLWLKKKKMTSPKWQTEWNQKTWKSSLSPSKKWLLMNIMKRRKKLRKNIKLSKDYHLEKGVKSIDNTLLKKRIMVEERMKRILNSKYWNSLRKIALFWPLLDSRTKRKTTFMRLLSSFKRQKYKP